MVLRSRELQPHQRRVHPREQEPEQAGDDVALRDRLVVDRREPPPQAGARCPRHRELGALDLDVAAATIWYGGGRHRSDWRYVRSASRSCGISWFGGMCAPGLMRCGSTIHPARLPRVLRIVPAASVRRLATCVRSGPACEPARVPSMLWHSEHELRANTCCPWIAFGSLGGVACACDALAHWLYAAGGSATTNSA